jgi:hypothetical protein
MRKYDHSLLDPGHGCLSKLICSFVKVDGAKWPQRSKHLKSRKIKNLIGCSLSAMLSNFKNKTGWCLRRKSQRTFRLYNHTSQLTAQGINSQNYSTENGFGEFTSTVAGLGNLEPFCKTLSQFHSTHYLCSVPHMSLIFFNYHIFFCHSHF